MCITFRDDDDDFLHKLCGRGGGVEKLNMPNIRRGSLMFDILQVVYLSAAGLHYFSAK